MFFKDCDSLKGKRIHVKESISTNKYNFDRHFSTYSEMEFELKNFGVRISGGRAMFMGENQFYEIGSNLLIKFENQGDNKYELVEKYSENVFRKSILKFL